MKKIGIKPNLRQFLTNKIKSQKKSLQIIPTSNISSNITKKKNPNTNSNKNLEKISLLNTFKNKDSKKIAKLIGNNNLKNINIPNYNFNNNININNNSFIKENQNDCNNFRKSKTTDKISGNKINLLIGYQDNQINNNNKKIMIKQNNLKKLNKLNINITKIPKYDNSSFKQVMKYYTLKSESKTIQIEELSTYFRPIRNILGFANTNKIKTQSNINSSINIHNNLKNNEKENTNLDIDNIDEQINNYNSIAYDDEKIPNYQSCTNLTTNNGTNDLCNNNDNNENDNSKSNIISNINTSLIKNCVINNKNFAFTQRNNKIGQIPFSIKIDKIDNTNKVINLNNNNYNNKTSSNNIENNSNVYINNIINSKNVSENETQLSTNNNLNNGNQDTKTTQTQSSQTLYQFRPRKIHLPKNGINLSTMQFKNQILQNILNKRKQNK